MREDSPRWEHVNRSEYAWEREGLRALADYLPDAEPYHVWANVEFIASDGSINEVDAMVLMPSGLYLLELKFWQGEVAGNGQQWVRRKPRGGRLWPVDSPTILVNRKAKRLRGVLRHYAGKQGNKAPVPYVGAAVFLHNPTMRSQLDAHGNQHVYGLHDVESGLPSLKEFVLSRPADDRDRVDARRAAEIVSLVRGANIRPSVAERTVGGLLLHAKPAAEGLGWQDFLGGHGLDRSLVRRVRVFLTSRLPADEAAMVDRAAKREFRLLQGIHHPGIASAHDLVDHPLGPGVVFDYDEHAERLDEWLHDRQATLTLAQKLDLVQDLAETVDYAHSRKLAHRALHPGAVSVSNPDAPTKPTLVLTDWQTGGRLPNTTRATHVSSSSDSAGLELFYDDEIRRYQAPEGGGPHKVSGVLLDVFSLGALTWRLFTGNAPAASPEELAALVRDSGLILSAAVDGLPETLVNLVYDATRGDPAERLRSVAAFRAGLEAVWEELTAPEPVPVLDPLVAHPGDVLGDSGLRVVRRLGSGGTSTALLVNRDDGRDLVLKVARDEQYADRLAAEARVIGGLQQHWQVAALVEGPIMVGARTALLLESAGEHTLAEELAGGRLALDLLERYGRDLMDIVNFLHGQTVWHRDIKPANLAARPRPSDSQQHLCIFDFSLSDTPADQITAGTVPYLDPFLGPPRRMRYDAPAERFAAAVTLYEMATGTLPRWADNANPAAVSDEVTLEEPAFDPAIADRLVAFFTRALARDAAHRFDTAEEMGDAWRLIFHDVPRAAPTPTAVGAVPAVDRDSALADVGLTDRARSALERLGVYTVGELLDHEPSRLTRARGVPDATRKEILAKARLLREQIGDRPTETRAPSNLPDSIESLCPTLLPRPTSRNRKEIGALQILLGQAPGADGGFLYWPTQRTAEEPTGQTQPQISTWLRKHAKLWAANTSLAEVRDEIVALLDVRGAVMSAPELAAALIAAHGSYAPEPRRTAQAIGLVQAAVEAELTRGGDSRLATRRFRDTGAVLVGREPDDPTATVPASEFLACAVRLGQRAARLTDVDPLPTRAHALDELRRVAVPEAMPPLDDQRLLQLAAAASNDAADVNAQGQLYPVGMSAERAVRLSAGALVGQRLTVDAVRSRVRARFPRSADLPDRLELERLFDACGLNLEWDPQLRLFRSRSVPGSRTATRLPSSRGAYGIPVDLAEVDARLDTVIERDGFLALMTGLGQAAQARRELLARLPLTEVDVSAIMIDTLKGLPFGWDAILAADSGSTTDADFRGLSDLVRHHVMPALREALAVAGPVLITEAAPLARYGQMSLIGELADPSRPRPAARLLLVPAWRADPPLLDQAPLPLTSRSQALALPSSFFTRPTERTAAG